MVMRFSPGMTLRQARDALSEVMAEGVSCPCCGQFAKVYRRKLNARQASTLLLVWRKAGREWAHVTTLHPSLAGNGGDISKLRYWGLVEEGKERRDDGGRPGLWRVTPLGEQFVRRAVVVPKYVRLYDSRCIGFDGEDVSIVDALGTAFNYEELMNNE